MSRECLNADEKELVFSEKINTWEKKLSGISESVGDEKGSDNRWGICSILTNVKEKKFVSGYKQWCVDKCLITGSAKKERGLNWEHLPISVVYRLPLGPVSGV